VASILVVDDSASSRALLVSLLPHGGHRVREASNGAEGLGLAKVDPPDVVIADALMPKMDGYQLVRQLRIDPVTTNVKVIFYTAAYLEEEVHKLAEGCGVTHVLTKPADPETILQTEDLTKDFAGFVAVSGIEGDTLAIPVRRAVVFGFNFGIERSFIVGIEAFVNVINVVGNRFESTVVQLERRNGSGKIIWHTSRLNRLNETKTIRWGTIKGRTRIGFLVHIWWIGGSPTENIFTVSHRVKTPFLDVARHVIRSKRSKTKVTTNRFGTFRGEVA